MRKVLIRMAAAETGRYLIGTESKGLVRIKNIKGLGLQELASKPGFV